MDVANRAVKLLIDTGSEITIVASDVIDNADEIETTNVALTGLSGNKHAIQAEGMIRAKLFINDVTIIETIYIIQRENTYLETDEFDGFLGREFLKRHGATIDLHNDTIQLRVKPVYEIPNSRMTTSRNSMSRPDIEFKTCNAIACSKCDGRVNNLRTKRLFRGMRIHKVNKNNENGRPVQVIIRPQSNINMNNGEAQTNESRNDSNNENEVRFQRQNEGSYNESQNEERNQNQENYVDENEIGTRSRNEGNEIEEVKVNENDNKALNSNTARRTRENNDGEIVQSDVDIGETFLAGLFNMEEEMNDEEEPDQNIEESDEEIERLLNFENLNVRISDDARDFMRCFANIATESASKED